MSGFSFLGWTKSLTSKNKTKNLQKVDFKKDLSFNQAKKSDPISLSFTHPRYSYNVYNQKGR